MVLAAQRDASGNSGLNKETQSSITISDTDKFHWHSHQQPAVAATKLYELCQEAKPALLLEPRYKVS
jgi:hypothetical protein